MVNFVWLRQLKKEIGFIHNDGVAKFFLNTLSDVNKISVQITLHQHGDYLRRDHSAFTFF